MSEIPVWAIWFVIVCFAFAVGLGFGLLHGPQTWRPGDKEILKLRHDNEVMRLKLEEVGRLIDRIRKRDAKRAT